MICSKFTSANTATLSRAFVLLAMLACSLTSGCKKPDAITEYTVPRTVSNTVPVVTSRMLAALVPYKDQAWFFKLSGPTAQVDPHADAYDQLLKSVTFDDRGEPQWTLPSGWKQLPKPANALQFATIVIGDGEINDSNSPQMLAISKLPYSSERHQQSVLLNINRWRGQMQLDPIGAVDLADESRELKLAEATAVVVDLRGNLKADGMSPFAGKNTPAAKAANSTTSGPVAAGTGKAPNAKTATGMLPNLPLTFDVPKEWLPAALTTMRVAAYQVVDGDQRAEITVIPLGPGAGDLKSNIDHWRGEIKLPPTASVEAAQALIKQLEVDGQSAEYIELVGPDEANPRESTLGVIVRRPDTIWFFKIRGAVDLVDREKPRFEAFVRSVKFKS